VEGGVDRDRAEYWARKKREAKCSRPPIPAGTVVRTRVAAWWGENPEDDPNPLLEVEAEGGARGLVFKDETEPA
jgi:hypothetical protein